MLRKPPQAIVRSRCKDIEMRGTVKDIISKYEGLAYQAQSEGRFTDMHVLFQHADHYKRVLDNGI